MGEIRLLCIEDDPEDVEIIRILLRDFFALGALPNVDIKVCEAATVKEAMERLSKEEFDAVLLDLNLPDIRGLEGLKTILNKYPTMPVILCTGIENDGYAISAIQNGAQDYLIKGEMNGSRLRRSIRYAIERVARTYGVAEASDEVVLRDRVFKDSENLKQLRRIAANGSKVGG